ncbi:MAG: biotin transporter BioY [Clostridiales bacterium]|nr:biotin transporter BioY [Clostridiales bacterium]
MTKQTAARHLVRVSLMAVLIAACAWITVPIGPVPFTLQTFGVYCALCLLGGKYGTLAFAVYLAIGALGAPVFSGFAGGIGKLVGPTGGYLIGFLAAGLIYWAAEKLFGEKPLFIFGAMFLGMLVCYAFGTAWFMVVAPSKPGLLSALGMCVFPYILPDIAKIVCAYIFAKVLKKRLKFD